jgi:hypothetical protein
LKFNPKPNQDFHTTKSAEVAKVKPIFLPFSPIMAEIEVQEKAYIAVAG